MLEDEVVWLLIKKGCWPLVQAEGNMEDQNEPAIYTNTGKTCVEKQTEDSSSLSMLTAMAEHYVLSKTCHSMVKEPYGNISHLYSNDIEVLV